MSETQPSVRFNNPEAVRERPPPPFLTLAEVGDLLRLGRTAVHEVVRRPDFPRPHGIGGRHRLWRRSEVLDWVDRQPRVEKRAVPASLAKGQIYRSAKLVPEK